MNPDFCLFNVSQKGKVVNPLYFFVYIKLYWSVPSDQFLKNFYRKPIAFMSKFIRNYLNGRGYMLAKIVGSCLTPVYLAGPFLQLTEMTHF
jgi:hypothetical protein